METHFNDLKYYVEHNSYNTNSSLDVEDINGKMYASIAKCTSKPKSKGKVAFDVLKKIGKKHVKI